MAVRARRGRSVASRSANDAPRRGRGRSRGGGCAARIVRRGGRERECDEGRYDESDRRDKIAKVVADRRRLDDNQNMRREEIASGDKDGKGAGVGALTAAAGGC
mmetsp:Transcript_31845/g.67850  ORF Transcript_31845/g.67850 Transcript_31845/m.67850 type:complete len:104 (+) Transcript_31845:659-970(+)